MENSGSEQDWGSDGQPMSDEDGSEAQDSDGSEEEDDNQNDGDYGFDAGPDAFAGNKVGRWLACTNMRKQPSFTPWGRRPLITH